MKLSPQIRRVGLILLATGATVAPLAAQRAPSVGRITAPTLMRDAKYEIVLLTHANAKALDADSLLARFFQGCRFVASLRRDDSLAVVRSRPWDWNQGAAADPTTLTILIRRASPIQARCEIAGDVDAVAAARGFQVVSSTAYPDDATITSARLRRGEDVIEAADVERTALTRVTSRGLVAVEGGLYRLTVPVDATAPDSSGSTRDLMLEIVAPDSTRSARIAIPWEILAPIWSQVLPSRSQRRESLDAANRPVFDRLARTTDPLVRTEARARLGANFAAAGDTAAARIVLGDALREEPCLTLHASAGVAQDVLRPLARRADRCTANLTRTVAVATLLPGFGNLDGPARKVYAATVLGIVAGTLAASQIENSDAEALYAQYLAVDGSDPVATRDAAARLYDRAEQARATGTALVAAGAATWLLSIAEAVWTERRLIRRLERVRDVRPGTTAVGVAPHVGPGRLGLALTFR